MFLSFKDFYFGGVSSWLCFLSLERFTFIRTLSCKHFSFLFILLFIFEQFEYQQAQLELEIENLSWKLERDELYCRGVSRE